MTTITSNQRAVLLAILTNDYGSFNGGKPPADYTFSSNDWQVWSNCLDCHQIAIPGMPKGKALSGTVGQMVAAGMLGSDGECVWFEELGFKLALEHDPR